MGKLHSLKELNIRRNNLHVLPDGKIFTIYTYSSKRVTIQHLTFFFHFWTELGDLPLVKLDFSCNKVTEIPICYRKLHHLQVIILDNNPLQVPPAQVCNKHMILLSFQFYHDFMFIKFKNCIIWVNVVFYMALCRVFLRTDYWHFCLVWF